MKNTYLMPPLLKDESGNPRKAGFEFEFGNLPILKTVESLQKVLGGEIISKTPFEAELHDCQLGNLKIERDANLLKSVKYRRWLETIGIDFKPGSIAHEIEANIDSASKQLVPCEVVTSPIPLNELDKLDTLTEALKAIGAEGTHQKLLYAFGLHINPSMPDRSATTLRRYIQAFLLLQSWIIESSQIDVTRRFFTKYIDPFPGSYMELVLDPDYKPEMSTLIDDYLKHNPTRNRALDMLPILCDLDKERVMNGIRKDERDLVKGRPAFHYRLPDCKVSEPDWRVNVSWNQWVYVEKLACDGLLLNELIDTWRGKRNRFSIAPSIDWALRLSTLLSQKFFEGL